MVISGAVVDNNNGSRLDTVLEYTQATDVNPDPKLELIPSAYVDQGGPVDPSTWSYFEAFNGVLTGQTGDAIFDGVKFSATLFGALPQIGNGANGKNVEFGLSNWFDLTVVEAPESSANCDVVVIPASDDNFTLNVGQQLNSNILDNDGLEGLTVTLSFDILQVPDGFILSTGEPAEGCEEGGEGGEGCEVTPAGMLSGSTLVPGLYVFTYTLTDADGNTATATVTIFIRSIGGPD